MPLSMVFYLVAAAVGQAMVPSWARLGMVKPPLLLGLVIYYALTRERHWALVAALLAGIFQDAMGHIPLGYSAAGFCLVALVVQRFRTTVFIFRAVTHVVLGTVCSVAVTLWLALLLSQDGLIELVPRLLAQKILGAMVLGAIAVPVAFRFAEALDVRLGLVEETST